MWSAHINVLTVLKKLIYFKMECVLKLEKSTQTESFETNIICSYCGVQTEHGSFNTHIKKCFKEKQRKEIVCPICLVEIDRWF